jgi:integrase
MAITQQKTDVRIDVPIHQCLQVILDGKPKSDLTFLLTAKGKSFSPAGFGNWFRKQCDAAGLPQCSAHGLRKAAARRLAEAGCTDREIMSITGHKTTKEVTRYTNAADQVTLSDQAMGKVGGTKTE